MGRRLPAVLLFIFLIPLIPVSEPPAGPGARPVRPTRRRGMTGDLVQQVQAKVGVQADGSFGPRTEAAVRAFQRTSGLVPDGIVGPKSWRALDAVGAPAAPANPVG